MKWPAVTKWVSNMISSGTCLYPSDADKMADYEINQLARRIMSFFSNAPEGFQRPTPRSDFDYWEGVTEIQEQLSDPEQVNTIYNTMMKPLMDATQPNDRSFETRKRGMEAMEGYLAGYLAGTFSVFGNDHTLRPLMKQAVNEDLERAKALIATLNMMTPVKRWLSSTRSRPPLPRESRSRSSRNLRIGSGLTPIAGSG